MSHPCVQSIYQKINRHFSVVICLFLLLVVIVAALFVFNEVRNKQQSYQELNQLKQKVTFQNKLVTTSTLLKTLTETEQGDELKSHHRALIAQWYLLSSMLEKKLPIFEKLLDESNSNQEVVFRIANNSAEYEGVRTRSIIQLQSIIDLLEQEIENKKQVLQPLYQLTMQGSTHSAKTYIQASVQLESLKQLKAILTNVHNGFITLSINTALIDFEKISQQVVQAFSLYEFIVAQEQDSLPMFQVSQLMTELELLLMVEELTLAKWRGYLRLASEYKMMVVSQEKTVENILHSQLNTLVFASNKKSNKNLSILFAWVDQASNIVDKYLKPDQQNTAALIIFVLIVLLFLVLLIRLHKKYKHYLSRAFSVDSVQNEEGVTEITELMTQLTQQSEKITCDEEKLSQLNEQVEQLKTQIAQQLLASQTLAKERMNLLSGMLTKAMLNAQTYFRAETKTHANVIKLEENLQSYFSFYYNELSTIAQWLEDKKIEEALASGEVRHLSDVNLLSEIQAACLNLLIDEQVNNNNLILNCDDDLIQQVKIDGDLFQRFLVLLCRLLFKDQKNALLMLSIEALHKNTGHQTVRVSGSLITETTLTQLPQHITLLITKAKCHNLSPEEDALLDYFQVLFYYHHADNLITENNKQGYEVSFELPLAMANGINAAEIYKPETNKLEALNTVVICQNINLQEQVTSYLDAAGAIVEVVKSSDTFSRMLSDELTSSSNTNVNISLLNALSDSSNNSVKVQEDNKKIIDLIIIANDCFDSDYKKVKQAIDTLPRNIQPKVMVLQNFYQAPLQQQGFFAQNNLIMSKSTFVNQVAEFIKNKPKNNTMIDVEQCQLYQHQPSQNEVLLAVNSPVEYQKLIRILHWLGLKVTCVTQPIVMKKQWQSGRYLVLINELDASPFIELETGVNLVRGVFTVKDFTEKYHNDRLGNISVNDKSVTEHSPLTHDDLTQKELTKLDGIKPDFAENWQFGVIPAATDLMALTTLLAPWLTQQVIQIKAPNAAKKLVSNQTLTEKTLTNKGRVDQAEKNDLISSKPSCNKSSVRICFEMNQYIKHQGSAELAIYMLDDYIDKINKSAAQLLEEVNNKNVTQINELTGLLLTYSKIIAATGLTQLSNELTEISNKKEFLTNEISKVMELLQQINREVKDINTYALALC